MFYLTLTIFFPSFSFFLFLYFVEDINLVDSSDVSPGATDNALTGDGIGFRCLMVRARRLFPFSYMDLFFSFYLPTSLSYLFLLFYYFLSSFLLSSSIFYSFFLILFFPKDDKDDPSRARKYKAVLEKRRKKF